MKKSNHIWLTITLYLITFLSKASEVDQQHHKIPFGESIANIYLKSFQKADDQEDQAKQKINTKDTPHKEEIVDEYSKRDVVLNKCLQTSKRFVAYGDQKQDVFNPYAWDDLKLLYGTSNHPNYHLMAQINRTKTILGECVLASLLTTPTSDVNILRKRQTIIQTLLKNPESVNKIQEELAAYALVTETQVLSLFTPQDQLYGESYQKLLTKKFYRKKNKSNFYPGKINAKRWWGDFWDIGFPVTSPLIYTGLSLGVIGIFEEKGVSKEDVKDAFGGWIPYYNICYAIATRKTKLKNATNTQKVFSYLGPVFGTLGSTISLVSAYKMYQIKFQLLKYLAEKMANIQLFIKKGELISQNVSRNEEIEKECGPCLVGLREFLSKGEENTDLGRLVKYLKTLPLQNWSYFFSNAGKLLASFKIFETHQQDFSEAFYDIGLIDAYIGITELVKEAQAYDANNHFTFVQYLDRTQYKHPYIQIQEMWNPFIDAKKAIPNSVEMGSGKDKIQTIILTGPNAGGKSTFLTGVTQSILLAQVFGIAPAKEMTLTPFDKINTYINKADDISSGKSLFKIEVEHAYEQLEMLKQLKEEEFSFSIMDELFSGTNPKEGEAAAYSIMEYIQKYKNGLNIIATHFPRVMLLEQNASGFANYKVYIKKAEKGSKKKNIYTHKVVPGKSNQAIAIDILEEEGYDLELLKRARDIVDNPQKYQASF